MKRSKEFRKEKHAAISYLMVICGLLLLVSCNGGKNTKESITESTVANSKEETAKFSAEDLLGVWDYYAESDPDNKIEMVFKKDGTLIDYIDFHSTGTYKVNPEGTVITMQFTYNDGNESQTSKPFDYTILEYTSDKLRLQVGESIICYDRKAKSLNYDGEL